MDKFNKIVDQYLVENYEDVSDIKALRKEETNLQSLIKTIGDYETALYKIHKPLSRQNKSSKNFPVTGDDIADKLSDLEEIVGEAYDKVSECKTDLQDQLYDLQDKITELEQA